MHSLLFYRLRVWRKEVLFASYLLLTAIVASLCVVIPAHAEAKDSEMTISPTSQRFEIAPGETKSYSFNILNSAGDQPIDVTVSAQPYQVKNAAYEPDFVKETPRTQISRWITFETTTYRVQPGQKAEVRYTVTAPQDMPDGGQYAVLFAETNAVAPEGSGVNTKKRAGMLVYARASGTARESSEASLKLPSLVELNGLAATAQIKNTGNVDFEANVSYEVKSLFGDTAFKGEKTATVIPDSTRDVSIEWPNKPLLGIYQAHMRVTHTGQTTEQAVWVLAIAPATLLLIAVLIGAILVAVVLRIRRSIG